MFCLFTVQEIEPFYTLIFLQILNKFWWDTDITLYVCRITHAVTAVPITLHEAITILVDIWQSDTDATVGRWLPIRDAELR